MKHLKKLTMMLALLITTATGAWAQAPYTVTFKANGNTKVFENVTFPHTFQCDIAYENGELDQVIRELYSIEKGFATYEPITVRLGSTNVSAGYDGTHPFVTINDAFEGSTFVSGDYNVELLQPNPYTGDEEWMVAYQQSYTLEITCEKVDVVLNDAQTVANVWVPANNMTVSYDLVRDMQDEQNPVTFGGLPTDGNIIVKKGTDGKYQPAGDFAITLLDGTQDIITNEDINVQVIIQKENELGAIDDDPDKEPITLTAFLSDMTPGYYRLKAEASENGAYDGTVYSTYLTVEEKYNLLVKPANDFSAGKLDAVTVGGQTATPNADGIITGVNPADEVKIKAKRGYVIEKVEGKKGAGLTYPIALSEVTEEYLGKVIGSDAKVYATAAAAQAAGTQAVAMIVYVGSETDNPTYNHGLALALANEDVTTNWPTAKAACRDKTPTVGRALWMLPSKTQWETMINAAGSDTALREAFSAVGGTNLNASYYWSSTQSNSSSAWDYDFLHHSWDSSVKNTDLYVRACLAF